MAIYLSANTSVPAKEGKVIDQTAAPSGHRGRQYPKQEGLHCLLCDGKAAEPHEEQTVQCRLWLCGLLVQLQHPEQPQWERRLSASTAPCPQHPPDLSWASCISLCPANCTTAADSLGGQGWCWGSSSSRRCWSPPGQDPRDVRSTAQLCMSSPDFPGLEASLPSCAMGAEQCCCLSLPAAPLHQPAS